MHIPTRFACVTGLTLLGLFSAVGGCSQQERTDARTSAGLEKPNESHPRNVIDRSVAGVESGVASIGDKFQDMVDNFSGNGPDKAAILMESPDPDGRRLGINRLAAKDFGRKPPYTTRYEQIARLDPDPLVRATAIRSLNVSRDKNATSIFVKALSDPNEQIRLEGCKALLHASDPEAVDPLLKLLTKPDENKDIRIAAADALRHYKSLEVARTLVGQLADRDFAIAWQSRKSLNLITGKDMKFDEAAWLAYLSGPDKPLG